MNYSETKVYDINHSEKLDLFIPILFRGSVQMGSEQDQFHVIEVISTQRTRKQGQV